MNWSFFDDKGKRVSIGMGAAPKAPLKLNLGCGSTKFDGFIGVDMYGNPDVRHDLEKFPWPWADSTVDEVALVHVLEHLGRDPDVFIGIIKELYRVCRNGALIHIVVPHPRHDNFLGDPTHVRPITYQVMQLFDKSLCEQFHIFDKGRPYDHFLIQPC